jgi:hypothetical protein
LGRHSDWNGARDGTRTRDLCRDRAGNAKQYQGAARLPGDRKGLNSAKVFHNPAAGNGASQRRCTHFVRFRSLSCQRLANASSIFGPPDFLHRNWDARARREIADGDVVLFANGDPDQPMKAFNGNDEFYA